MARSLASVICMGWALLACPGAAAADEAEGTAGDSHSLRYQFREKESVVWRVEHRARVRTTVSGTTQTADTVSISAKRWRITNVAEDGTFTLVHSVDYVDMRQQMSDRAEEHFDSRSNESPPPGFQDVAKAVKIPLSVVKMNARGEELSRQEKHPQPNSPKGQMTILLPEAPVKVGHTWHQSFDIDVALPGGAAKRIKGRQQYRLAEVVDGIATIAVETQWLTPINDPAIEAQLIQRDTSGTVKFDIGRGRVISQQTEIDKHVVGFQGSASSMHYTTRFSEELLPAEPDTAAAPSRKKR